MGTDISHIVKHDFKLFHDRGASKAFCEKVYEHMRKELLLGDGEPEWDEPGVLDDEEDFMQISIADYDMNLRLLPDFWEIESYARYSFLLRGERVRKWAFDVVRALGAKETWHAEEYFTWNGDAMEYPGCNFEEWMAYLGREYEKPIQEFSPSAYWELDSNGFLDIEPVYHDSFKECFAEFDQLQNSIPNYRLLGISRVGDHFLRCEKNGELYLIDERWKTPLIDAPVQTYWTFDKHFVVIKDGKSALFDSSGTPLTPFVKGFFKWKRACDKIQRGGIKMHLEKEIIENVQAKLSLTVFEKYGY